VISCLRFGLQVDLASNLMTIRLAVQEPVEGRSLLNFCFSIFPYFSIHKFGGWTLHRTWIERSFARLHRRRKHRAWMRMLSEGRCVTSCLGGHPRTSISSVWEAVLRWQRKRLQYWVLELRSTSSAILVRHSFDTKIWISSLLAREKSLIVATPESRSSKMVHWKTT